MPVAFDAITIFPATEATGNFSETHTPAGTPRGVIVLINQEETVGSDEVTSVTYGGVPLAEVPLSPVINTAGEGGVVYGYYLGSSVPAGAQTVTVNVDAGGSPKKAACLTLTAAVDTEVVDTSEINSGAGTIANPSETVSLGGRTCFVCQVWYSGQADPSSVTPLANWTDRNEYDYGGTCARFYTYDTIAAIDITAGYTASADDVVLLAIAASEVQAAARVLAGPMFLNGGS